MLNRIIIGAGVIILVIIAFYYGSRFFQRSILNRILGRPITSPSPILFISPQPSVIVSPFTPTASPVLRDGGILPETGL
ncbi:hypothetical protein HY408_01950 [Candidatus Gottesmanbacteria bacterium]|nr:hypothetical protein [Candidatus Gottesmanbacteria bacterium]